MIQYGPPDVDYTIDIVSRLGDAFTFEDLEIEAVEVGDGVIDVVSERTLAHMKRDSARLRDLADAERLTGVARLESVGSVRKYRGIEDVPSPPPAADAYSGMAAACALSELSRAFGHTTSAPRGVRKFRSIEEADAHRRTWELPPRR